jgi:REP element-mobilizing transposase RayT
MTPQVTRFPIRRTIRLPQQAYREGNVFLVTIGTSARFPWFRQHTALAERAVAMLIETADVRKTQLYAWCVMPDHVHLLLQDADLTDFVRIFKGRLTPVARQFQPERPLWQRSFHDHGLRREESVDRVAQYIFENPVRAGLVSSPADYPWSGSNAWPQWRQSYQRAGINPAPT